MASMIGGVVGGILIILLLSYLVEWAVVKRVMDDPTKGLILSTALATALAIVLYGFGNADGGSWNPAPGFIPYLFGGVIAAIVRLMLYKRAKAKSEE